MFGKRENTFCLYLEKGSSGLQDEKSQREGTQCSRVKKTEYVQKITSYLDIWKTPIKNKNPKFKNILIKLESNNKKYHLIEDGFVTMEEIKE